MWEPYTERARLSIIRAQEEAFNVGAHLIRTSHLLVGIASETPSFGARILRLKNLDLIALRENFRELHTASTKDVDRDTMIFTHCLKETLRIAFDISYELTLNYVGTETLLLAICREGNGFAANLLKKHGVTQDFILEALGY